MRRRGFVAVAGYSDRADEALLTQDGGLERAAGAGGAVEVLEVADGVKLDQVHAVDPQAL